MKFLQFSVLLLIFNFLLQQCNVSKQSANQERPIWTGQQANDWYARQPWLIGSNFLPSTAINQLEMWQAETFDTATINRELSWAKSLGMNTMRVFLHDLTYEQNPTAFLQRMEIFLQIANRHNIRPMLVLFDSVWDPYPKLGKQRDPKPHVHNSGWVQSPGAEALRDSTQYPRLERFVKGVITKFANDKRVLAWDVWNEPDNDNRSSYGKVELENKIAYVLPLLQKVFVWARTAHPSQPITAGIWWGDWSSDAKLAPIQKVMVEQSDIISFHNYDNAQEFEKRVQWLKRYNRPILCTEYMARPNGSTFASTLPIAKKYNVAVYNWGFVDGKSQTIYPWDSWDKTYTAEPPLWFHDIFRNNGTPYKQEEVDLIKEYALSKK